jgi:hypothetical protein
MDESQDLLKGETRRWQLVRYPRADVCSEGATGTFVLSNIHVAQIVSYSPPWLGSLTTSEMTIVQRNDLTQILREAILFVMLAHCGLDLLKNAILIVRLLLPLGKDHLHQDSQASFGGNQIHSPGTFQGHRSEKFGSTYCLGYQQACATLNMFRIYLR